MDRFSRLSFVLVALSSALSLRSADELRLVGQVDGNSYPFGGVRGNQLLLRDGNQTVSAPPNVTWRLEGDLRTHAELVRWAPYYTIARASEPELILSPDKPFRAESSFVLSPPVGSESNQLVSDWPDTLSDQGIAVSAWLVDGNVVETLVEPLKNSPTSNVDPSIGFRFFLTANQSDGQPINLLWSDGAFVTPQAHFPDPALNRALVAALFDDPALLRDLTDSDLNAKSGEALTLVQYATDAGSVQTLHHFTDIDPRTARQLDSSGASLLHRTARKGRLSIIHALVTEQDLRVFATRRGDSPLDEAIKFGHLSIVNELLAAGAMPRARSDQSAALNFAVSGGFVDIADALVAGGATFDFKSKLATHLLVEQAEKGHMAMLLWLTQHGVEINNQNESAFVLFSAAATGSGELAKALLAAGADPNKTRANGFSPLMVAAEASNPGFAIELIAAGAEVDARLESGATALHIAAHANAAEFVESLLEAGADINAQNKQDLTAFDAALLNGSGAAARALAQRGAHIDLGAAHSQRLLEAALRWDIPEPVAAALKEGWPAESTFAGTWPAIRLARLFDAKECEALLIAAGATVDDNRPVPIAEARSLDERLSVVRAVNPSDPRSPDESYPQSTVRMEIIVDNEGRPLFPKIISADDPRLGTAAQNVISQWRFSAPRKNGLPAATRAVLPMTFPASIDRVFELTELSEKPRPILRVIPVYPIELRNGSIQGLVSLVFVVDARGSPREIRVERSTNRGFEAAAIEAVRQWKFEPGKFAGRPVSTRVRQELAFNTN